MPRREPPTPTTRPRPLQRASGTRQHRPLFAGRETPTLTPTTPDTAIRATHFPENLRLKKPPPNWTVPGDLRVGHRQATTASRERQHCRYVPRVIATLLVQARPRPGLRGRPAVWPSRASDWWLGPSDLGARVCLRPPELGRVLVLISTIAQQARARVHGALTFDPQRPDGAHRWFRHGQDTGQDAGTAGSDRLTPPRVDARMHIAARGCGGVRLGLAIELPVEQPVECALEHHDRDGRAERARSGAVDRRTRARAHAADGGWREHEPAARIRRAAARGRARPARPGPARERRGRPRPGARRRRRLT